MATFIRTSGEPVPVTPGNGRSFTLVELQTFVGGYIEVIRTYEEAQYMVLNEDGKRLALPLNPTATALVRGLIRPDDVIVGDVLIGTLTELGEDDDDPDDPDGP